jgi:hypothetical protein
MSSAVSFNTWQSSGTMHGCWVLRSTGNGFIAVYNFFGLCYDSSSSCTVGNRKSCNHSTLRVRPASFQDIREHYVNAIFAAKITKLLHAPAVAYRLVFCPVI